MSTTHDPASPVLIAVMGLTGSGKSSFINLASQSNKLKVGHSIKSCTSTVDASEPFMIDGRQIILYDTPGFDDTNLSESEILRVISIELENQYRKGQVLHGIIYVHRISDLRVGGLAKTNFRLFRKLCGDNSLKNVIIMTNMWSKVDELEGRRRVAELASLEDFFLSAIEKGALMVHHNPETIETAHNTIREILKNHPEPLTIQREIVDENKKLTETGAGIAVDEKLAQLKLEYEAKLKEQLEAAAEAQRERDEETRREQLEEAAKVQAALKRMEDERRNQAELYRKLQEKLAAAEEARKAEVRAAEKRAADLQAAIEAQARERALYEEREAERRRQELAEAERRFANMRVNEPSPVPPAPPKPKPSKPSYRLITSGDVWTLVNRKYNLLATIDRDAKYVTLQKASGSRRQDWKFHSSMNTNEYWTIESVSNPGYFMSVTSRGTMKTMKSRRSDATTWKLRGISDMMDEFRIYLNDFDDNDGQVLSVDVGAGVGSRVSLYDKVSSRDEIWEIN